jgi:hypothetical protein
LEVSPYYSESSKVKRYIKEGRGQGVGVDYIPWNKTYDFSSKGRVTRLQGIVVPRIYYLLSDNMYRAFLNFEFSGTCSDIRESYPLLDVMEVIDDKDGLRFDKFCDKETKEPYIITTSFLLTVKDEEGKGRLIARTVKNSSELNRKLTFEKLEVEHRYWKSRQVDWKIITEKQLPKQMAKNIEWVRETMLVDSENELDKEGHSLILLKYLMKNVESPIKEILGTFDRKEGLSKGSGLYLFRYLIAKKELQIKMHQKIDLSVGLKSLLINGGRSNAIS